MGGKNEDGMHYQSSHHFETIVTRGSCSFFISRLMAKKFAMCPRKKLRQGKEGTIYLLPWECSTYGVHVT